MKKTFFLALLVALTLSTPAHTAMKWLNSSSVDLGTFSEAKCSTGLTCTVVSGRLNMVASSPSFTLESGEVLNNTVDDTVEIISNDEHTTLKVTGFEAKDAILELAADQEDDAADLYSLKADTSNVLSILNSTNVLATVSAVGDWAFKGTTPYLTIGDAGAEDAGLVFDGNAQDYNISLDDTADTLVIGLGSAAGTTDAIRIDANQDVTFVQNVLGLGTDSLSGFLQKQVTATATTITAAQCGSTFINSGAIEMELPEASTVLGCRLTFIIGNASAFTIDPDGGDQIMLLTNAAGDSLIADAVGESLVIEAISASAWAPVGAEKGTWTDSN